MASFSSSRTSQLRCRVSAYYLVSALAVACTGGQSGDESAPWAPRDAGPPEQSCPTDGGLDDVEAMTLVHACPAAGSAETCGDGTRQAGEVCFAQTALAPPDAPELEPISGNQLSARRIAAADLDGDGYLDIAATFVGTTLEASTLSTVLAVYWGSGSGFGTAQVISTWALDANSPTLADLDGDGRRDIAAVINGFGVVIEYGQDDRSFEERRFELDGARLVPLVADFDGDGKDDLLFTGGKMLVNQGDRDFEVVQDLAPAGMQVGFLVALADFDGDGSRDLLTQLTPVGASKAALYLVPGIGDGEDAPPMEVPNATDFASLVIDADGDHKLDVAGIRYRPSAAPPSALLEARLWLASMSYSPSDDTIPLTPPRGAISSTISRQAVDIDGDDHEDLLFAEEYAFLAVDGAECAVPAAWRTVHLALGDGNGGFSEPECHPAFEGSPLEVQAADLNGDGDQDLAGATTRGIEILMANN
jgi:hypothetical protein